MKIKKDIYNNKSSFLILLMLLAVAAFGLLSPYNYNILPANIIFEATLLLSAVVSIKKKKKKTTVFLAISFTYVALCYLIMETSRPAHILDFVQAYKSFIYIIPLCFFIGREKFNESQIRATLLLLLLLFATKYGYSRALKLDLLLGSRPGIYTENNFELILLLIIYYLAAPSLGKLRAGYFFLLALIVAMSGSRSAVLGLVIVYIFTFFQKLDFKFIISTLALIIITALAFYIFSQRNSGSIEDIDRYRFLMIFLEETKEWDLINILLGSRPLTPFSSYSCSALGFYKSLFSFSGDGTCYSVILHSYLLRVIFDHGILGFYFVLYFVWYGLSIAQYSTRQKLCIISVLLASGLSVSSLNSIYVAIALAISFSYPQKRAIKIHS